MNKQTAKSCGFNYGTDAIELCTVGKYDKSDACCGCASLCDDEICEECLTAAAGNTEIGQRDFSPFEFLAAEFNASEESCDDLWEAYEDGVMEGIRAGMAARLAAEKYKHSQN